MLRYWGLLLIGALSGGECVGQAEVLQTPVECHARQGLPNVFGKLEGKQAVTIAYFGGSITQAAGGWREQSAAWIGQQYPGTEIKPVNAAIGGTGSDLGVFRLQQDVIKYQPDLVFVEFAVNDNGLDPERIYRTMEGIVRQIRKADDRTDICFVYTLTGVTAPTLAEGHLTPAMSAMEKIADHYGIPSVQLGLEVVELFKKDQLIFKGIEKEHPDKIVFSGDNVHPYPKTGHRLYTAALSRSWALLKGTQSPPRPLKAPFRADNWENARMIPASELARSGEWLQPAAGQDAVARQFETRFPGLLKSETPGASLTLHFKGRLAGLYDVVGPGCGQYEVSIDGEAPKHYPRFDRYSVYYRSHYFFLPELPVGSHTVTWQVAAETLDKMAILAQGNNAPGDPAKFVPNACYAGYVLLLGERE